MKNRCVERQERLKRHEEASEKLNDEIDIVKLVYVQRIGQFLAKLILKKHQRALVTSFKKYQIDDLGKSSNSDGTPQAKRDQHLEPSIQEDGTVDDLGPFLSNPNLTED